MVKKSAKGATIQYPGGLDFFCREPIMYFSPARHRAENFKLYYMYISNSASCKLYIENILEMVNGGLLNLLSTPKL